MPYAAIDVETTGLDPTTDRIIEVGVAVLDDSLALETTFHTLVNPARPVSAQHIHHISDEMLSNAPFFTDIIGSLIGILDGHILVAHNAPFDLGFLNAELTRAATPYSFLRENAVCTMDQSRIYCSDGSHSLLGLAGRLGIETPVAHRALADALTCSELFQFYFAAEESGQRIADYARNRQGNVILPAEWKRACPWHARFSTN
ncbi:3'-5' exonuclease [Arcanobacterium buesumense]|uniref:3'-5' exonuclease n=1 Tax=Arcanobacterium buesumense TaxID=2722751 RepID=A0A6H2EKU9_9ACTO|nr:3'-5' exonuclease [Arcanobacterium buesumense]QJC21683.1 3'-5' exonuclease [Arcanobacterium buesumense]